MEGEVIDEKEQITRKERKYFLLMLMVELQLTGRKKEKVSCLAHKLDFRFQGGVTVRVCPEFLWRRESIK